MQALSVYQRDRLRFFLDIVKVDAGYNSLEQFKGSLSEDKKAWLEAEGLLLLAYYTPKRLFIHSRRLKETAPHPVTLSALDSYKTFSSFLKGCHHVDSLFAAHSVWYYFLFKKKERFQWLMHGHRATHPRAGELALYYRDEGFSYRQIGIILGLSKSSVSRVLPPGEASKQAFEASSLSEEHLQKSSQEPADVPRGDVLQETINPSPVIPPQENRNSLSPYLPFIYLLAFLVGVGLGIIYYHLTK